MKCTLLAIKYFVFFLLREFLTHRTRIHSVINNINNIVPPIAPPIAAPIAAPVEASCDVSTSTYMYMVE